jgi:hypothetical protein
MAQGLGRLLISFGLVIAAVGFILYRGWKIPIGRLPGDIHVRIGNTAIYFPVITCILLSLLLTLVMNLFKR